MLPYWPRIWAIFICLIIPSVGQACTPRDFLGMILPAASDDLAVSSVLFAYPTLSYDAAEDVLRSDSGAMKVAGPSEQPPHQALETPTFGAQFRYVYPLAFDLTQRETPWVDPGRLRNADFMALLYFEDEATARASLTQVTHPASGTTFNVTQKQGVACQLQAALAEIGPEHGALFQSVGGSFNWRVISGTTRLSVHSYGAAVDLSTKLGAYWKWQGGKPGGVGPFANQIPQDVVQAFEKYGFIWGGKWHHFDSMHFEYRPELIVYARLFAGG